VSEVAGQEKCLARPDLMDYLFVMETVPSVMVMMAVVMVAALVARMALVPAQARGHAGRDALFEFFKAQLERRLGLRLEGGKILHLDSSVEVVLCCGRRLAGQIMGPARTSPPFLGF